MSDNLNKNNDLNFSIFDTTSVSKSQKDLELKIDWFVHVLNSLEKLADKYTELNNKMYIDKSSLTSDIISVKDSLYTELKNLRGEFSLCRDSCHSAFDAVKNKLDTKVEKVIVKMNYDKERMEDTVFSKLNERLEKLNNKVSTIHETLISVKIKIAMIGAVGGIFGSVVLLLIQLGIKKYF